MNPLAPVVRNVRTLMRALSLPSLDKVIVIDLEATTWADRPWGALREVIEIGVCELHMASGAVGRADSLVVRPCRSQVSPHCTRITGITPEQAAAGVRFATACDWLRSEYASERRAWASFGGFDREQLAAQCAREGVRYPFASDHMDIRLVAALRFGWRRGRGLARALHGLGMTPEGRPRSARDECRECRPIALRGPARRR